MASGCDSKTATSALYSAIVGTVGTVYQYGGDANRNTINVVSRGAITRCGSSVNPSTCRLIICGHSGNGVVTDVCSGDARIFRGCVLGSSNESNTTMVVTVFPILVRSTRFRRGFRRCCGRFVSTFPSVAGAAGTVTVLYSGTCEHIGSRGYTTRIGINLSGTNGLVEISRTRLSSNGFRPARIITNRFGVFTQGKTAPVGGTATIVRRDSFIKGFNLSSEAFGPSRRTLIPRLPS